MVFYCPLKMEACGPSLLSCMTPIPFWIVANPSIWTPAELSACTSCWHGFWNSLEITKTYNYWQKLTQRSPGRHLRYTIHFNSLQGKDFFEGPTEVNSFLQGLRCCFHLPQNSSTSSRLNTNPVLCLLILPSLSVASLKDIYTNTTTSLIPPTPPIHL